MYCSGQRNGENATVAQLVEYDLAKVGVAGSNPVYRSHSFTVRKQVLDNDQIEDDYLTPVFLDHGKRHI